MVGRSFEDPEEGIIIESNLATAAGDRWKLESIMELLFNRISGPEMLYECFYKNIQGPVGYDRHRSESNLYTMASSMIEANSRFFGRDLIGLVALAGGGLTDIRNAAVEYRKKITPKFEKWQQGEKQRQQEGLSSRELYFGVPSKPDIEKFDWLVDAVDIMRVTNRQKVTSITNMTEYDFEQPAQDLNELIKRIGLLFKGIQLGDQTISANSIIKKTGRFISERGNDHNCPAVAGFYFQTVTGLVGTEFLKETAKIEALIST